MVAFPFTLFTNALSQLTSAIHTPFTTPTPDTLTLPTGWSYRNCYQHIAPARALSVQLYNGTANTPASCAALCDRAGYTFAGAASGQQCWCGSALENDQVATCTTPCSGDSSQTCGDSNQISVFSKVPISTIANAQSKRATRRPFGQRHPSSSLKKKRATYQSYGCYVDANTRILPLASTSSTSMTTAYCQSFCAAQNPSLSYFGTENGNECWCGSSLPSSSAIANAGDCSTTCTGDSTSKCGGGWRLNVYGPIPGSTGGTTTTSTWTSMGCFADQNSRTLASTSFTSSSMTPALCQQNCAGYAFAGTEAGQECWCGSSMSSSVSSSGCTSTCTGDSTKTCGGNWAISVYKLTTTTSTISSTAASSTVASSTAVSTTATTTTSSSTPTTSSWTSLGCYADQSARTLNGQTYSNSAMTPTMCEQLCTGYAYAGVEYSTECYCGTSMTNMATSSACSSTCGGDSSKICGGSWAINVYHLTASTITSSTAVSTTATTTSSSATATSSSWISRGCYADQSARTLNGATFSNSGMTPAMCQQLCVGYTYAGTEYSDECYCGTSMTVSTTSSACSSTCAGDSSKICGGSWALSVYQLTGTSGTTTATSTSSAASSTATTQPVNGLWWTANGSNTGKIVVAHFIVGNTYGRTSADWTQDITQAAAQGIDGFALNMGIDDWQPARMQNAYDAAAALSASGINFKMFVSFDMTSLNCGSTGTIVSIMQRFAGHSAQMKTSAGEMIVSTFAGGECGSMWQNTLGSAGVSYRFIPAFFNDISGSTMKSQEPAIGGDFLWGGAWPSSNTAITWDNDNYRIQHNGLNRAGGDLYMTSVSPWFYVHLNGDRNYVFDFDNWLYVERWEMLHDQRALVDIVQIVTWNDWGESHYIAPVDPNTQDIPSGATAYVTPQYDHTAFMYMTGYFASYYKTGNRPTVTADKIFMWGRTQPASQSIGSDPIGPVQNAGWVADTLFVVLFATSSGTLTINQGGSTWTTAVVVGPNRLSHALVATTSVTAVLTRNSQTVFTFTAPLIFGQGSPSSYNFNCISASGP
ncbi:hypothetical protein FRB93_007415 [Tulasnella sp. JGI-2019a]|nr:hypothetical protein FRB93_007415 [Tulasnella sp. JGI-2019a]